MATGYLHPQILPGGVIGPRVGIAAGSGQALMAKRLLYEVGRGAAIKSMRGMGMPKPAWRDALGGTGVLGGLLDDAPEL